MNFELKLADLIENTNGVFDDIKWGSMRGSMHTLGTMTDDHLANSRYYHKHMAEVARVAYELNISITECKFNQYLMEAAITKRKLANTWSIDVDDFRVA